MISFFSTLQMRIRRSFPIFVGVLLVAAALTIIVQLRKHAPPEPARLLPGADGFLYVNLKWMRRINTGAQLPPVSHDPEYEQFIQATGFQFERDLDQAAFAIHYPTRAGPSEPPRFTEIFTGKINGEKLRPYFRKLSGPTEDYGSIDIYNIPLNGHTLRVAILGVDTVAASNHKDPLVIRGVIDRSRKVASPFGGPRSYGSITGTFLLPAWDGLSRASLWSASISIPRTAPSLGRDYHFYSPNPRPWWPLSVTLAACTLRLKPSLAANKTRSTWRSRSPPS